MDSHPQPTLALKPKAPSPRRDAREAALQFLYANDAQGTLEFTPEKLSDFWQLRDAKSQVQTFAEELVNGVASHLEDIDSILTERLENYSLGRVSIVDRNILRLGIYEILWSDHIPRQAAINEAIEIAKRFGGEDSYRFINGILDKIRKS